MGNWKRQKHHVLCTSLHFKVSWWVDFYKKCEKSFFAVPIEKTEINILQKEWRKKALLLFKTKRKTIFESH